MQDVELSEESERSGTEQWANNVHRHHRIDSAVSEGTLFGTHSPGHSQDTFVDTKRSLTRSSRLSRVGQIAFAVVERFLVVAAFAQLLVGVVTYSGERLSFSVSIGRSQPDSYYSHRRLQRKLRKWMFGTFNKCVTFPLSQNLFSFEKHVLMYLFLEGGIFWCYGLLTFARFLGSFADCGWAWNRSPSGPGSRVYSAEFVESFVIFLYGATNTWMERFGANPGDPFTTKQIQHISIAVSDYMRLFSSGLF